MSKIAITMGDPAGIGPEIIMNSLNSMDIDPSDYILIGNKEVFSNTNIKLVKDIEFINIPCDISQIHHGIVSQESGRISFSALETACKLVQEGKVRAIVTAPVSKLAINMAGNNYSGQTEILEKYLGKSSKAEMLFVAGDFKVMLLTRHIELARVSSFLTVDKIINSVIALSNSLKNDFRIKNPKIAICGLNPHAGEEGLLGQEESQVIIPALNILRHQYNVNINGPFPADTVWINAGKSYLNNESMPYDAYVACYHDQGLIPIKLLALKATVNTTINLPVIRTSPSHGTAFDIAGKNIADYESMQCAIELAANISNKSCLSQII